MTQSHPRILDREHKTVQWGCLRFLCVLFCLTAPAAEDQLGLGVRQLRSGSTFAAVRTLRQALKDGNARAHLYLAEAYFVLNQHALFVTEIAAAKTTSPADPEPYYIEGRFAFQIEASPQTAANFFEQALARDPGHIKAQYYAGVALRSMQKMDEAEVHLKKAMQLADARSVSFYLPYQTLAEQLLDAGRIEEAEGYIKAAVRMAPEVALNQFLLGKIMSAQSHPAEAIAALRTTVQLDEAFLEARYMLARILEKQGDAAGSKQQFAEFQALKDIYGAGRLR